MSAESNSLACEIGKKNTFYDTFIVTVHFDVLFVATEKCEILRPSTSMQEM